jgi:hypothetical protein
MTKAFTRWIAQIAVALAAVLPVMALHAAEVRYDDVVYLNDWNQPVLHLKALRRVPVTFSRDPNSVIGYLAKGQSVEIIGLGENQHCVKASLATGSVSGWVEANALEPSPADLLAKLRERREKASAHRELIERHEVVTGMTRAEVRASVGAPDRTARVRTRLGDEEQWFYITYKYVPQYTQHQNERGQLGQLVSYRRTPAGRKAITFRGDEVIETAGNQAEESLAVIAEPPAHLIK